MLPTIDNNDYPKFVADQLLTAAALNDMFGYLDEQDRLTRADLLGIGIVCGLHVVRHGDAIEITKGCGITSAGYLIVEDNHADDIAYNILPTTKKYTGYKTFDALKPKYYEKFVDDTDPANKKQIDLWEMFPSAVTDATPMTSGFLSDKAVLIFVELREENNKNCDPDSCDDKGIKVIMTFRKLLIKKTDAEKLMKDLELTAAPAYNTKQAALHRRFDVVATELASSTDIFEAYQKVIAPAAMEQLLTHAWDTFKPLIVDIYPANPFTGLAAQFNFIFNGTATKEQLLNFQYYYDFFNDLREAYAELRNAGVRIIGQCVPGNLFPRHLLLGEATGTSPEVFSELRNYFTPSPILEQQHHLVEEFRFLFKKIKLMTTNFIKLAAQQAGESIRITPSLLGDHPLSKKAIPYYYQPMQMYEWWNYKRTHEKAAKYNLSYHATEYNTTDEYIRQPLLFDLEPFNFLRIEGIIGKNIKTVLSNLTAQRSTYRLPFQVVALGTNARALWDMIKHKPTEAELGTLMREVDKDDIFDCHFQDLEALYDAMMAELTCSLCKEMKYYYELPMPGVTGARNATEVPTASLLQKCDPGFRFAAQTVGASFEDNYAGWKSFDNIASNLFSTAFSTSTVSVPVELMLPFVMFRIEKLYESLADNLNEFDSEVFSNRYELLQQTVQQIKHPSNQVYTQPSEDIKDHLDTLLYACRKAGIKSIIEEYRRRAAYVFALKKLGYFIKQHPGIQHKAGVPIGGTFIVVYHEQRAQSTATVRTGNFTLKGRVIRDGAPVPNAVVVVKEMPYTAVANILGQFNAYTNRLPVTLMVVTFGWQVAEFTINDIGDAATIDLSASAHVEDQPDLGGFLTEFSPGADDSEQLKALLANVEEGTVIADFYLPYSCCSDCPPVMSTVGEDKPAVEPVTISLEPEPGSGANEYCVNDTKLYTFAVSPTGGTVTGAAGVSQASGVYKFNPSQAAAWLGGRPQRQIKFTYTKDGQTATVDAVVYNMPDASFNFFEATTNTSRIFLPGTAFGETFAWDFGDGSTSNERNPVHDFDREGSFTVKLTVTNGPCKGVKTAKVDIKKREQPKTCTPAGPVIEKFKQLESVDPQHFTEFKAKVPTYEKLEHLLISFQPVLGGSVTDQLDFLESEGAIDIITRVLDRELVPLIIDPNSMFRMLALSLYTILVRVVLYIACVQDEDVDKARVKTAEVLGMINAYVNRLVRIVSIFSAQEKALLIDMNMVFKQELGRLTTSGEAAAKPVYVSLLQKIIQALDAL